MSANSKEMNIIKQVLLHHKEGVSNRKIAALVGINKETVNKYVGLAKRDDLSVDKLLELDDPVLERRLTNGRVAYPDERFEAFRQLLPYLEDEMANQKKTHVTLYQLWLEYRREHPDGYSLTQFRYHYRQNCKAKPKASTPMADLHQPGVEVFLDFAGDKMEYIDRESGEIIRVAVFLAVLPYSNYTFAIAIPSQRTDDVVYAMTQAFRFFGGVPYVLVPDNMKSAVIKSDRYEPSFNETFLNLANHYKATIQPARPLHPKDKSNVEGHVRIVYNRVYAPLRHKKFYSLQELNEAIFQLTMAHNQKRMQQKPYTREEQFLSAEKSALQPLPDNDFEIMYKTKLMVSTNNCIYLGRDKHYYSVPHRLIGEQVSVVYTRTLVKIYFGGELVATHRREVTAGKYSILKEHLPENAATYRGRSKQYYITRAARMMNELEQLISLLFYTSTQPEQVHYKTCDCILHLARNTEPAVMREACKIAIARGRYNYGLLSQLVKSSLVRQSVAAYPQATMAPKNHEGIRGKSAFQ